MLPSSYIKKYRWELVFSASVPALGFSIYSVVKVTVHNPQAQSLQASPRKPRSYVLAIENEVRLYLNLLPCLCDKFQEL